jgi:midasin
LQGETGTGKTTTIQMLAQMYQRPLIVQNVSLQTDSTDLLGGYKPVELKHLGRKLYVDFVDLFTGTFSRKQNAKFLAFAAQSYERGDWPKLSQCLQKAAELGLAKVIGREEASVVAVWKHFQQSAIAFEHHRGASGPVFEFVEGALVDAIRTGKWVLLDEINLASSETLQRLCGLLNDSTSSLTITERGDLSSILRHPSFRLFAAMNPATDTGKKDLAPRIRNRFTEIYVDEILNPLELRTIVAGYLKEVLDVSSTPAEQSESVISVVDTYLKCRELADHSLSDGNGQKPRYTLRTLTRAVTSSRQLILQQKFALQRALVEGFLLAFQGPLDSSSFKELNRTVFNTLGRNIDKSQLEQPCRRPGGRRGNNGDYILIAPFWIERGDSEVVDWASETDASGRSRFVLLPSTMVNLRRLSRSMASGSWPILLEGPTSAGKTTLIEYVAARCGHKVVRINNHEHTDVQEYIGSFTPDSDGRLSFHDGILVSALRKGHWVILDELNLAPSDVLEALNRLLDDNRELFIPETNETVKPHRNFRLFATQNPSGSYGGRKPLSRAFRNRFVEIQVNDIPSDELVSLLTSRCGCPQSHATLLVTVMTSLRQMRSQDSVFLGSESFITPRDLLRWAARGATTKRDLAAQGFMILAERLRCNDEKQGVLNVIQEIFKLKLDLEDMYFGSSSTARSFIEEQMSNNVDFPKLALTKSLLRLVTLVLEASRTKEPVLLVGGEFSTYHT